MKYYIALIIINFFQVSLVAQSFQKIEFETARIDKKNVKVLYKTGASKNKCISFKHPKFRGDKSKIDNQPELVIELKVPHSGKYTFQGRFQAPDTGSDSLFYCIDDSPVKMRFIPVNKNWQKVDICKVFLKAGTHKLKFWTREMGLLCDYITVINDYSSPISVSVNAQRVHVQNHMNGDKELSLKSSAKARFDDYKVPDAVYSFRINSKGKYSLHSFSSCAEKNFSGQATAMISVDKAPPRKIKIFSSWKNRDNCQERLIKLLLSSGIHKVRIWLPEKITLKKLELRTIKLPELPGQVKKFVTKKVPPSFHPRLLVTPESLKFIKDNLNKGENKAIWDITRNDACKKLDIDISENSILKYDAYWLRVILSKAFVSLVSHDKARGREAVELINNYLSRIVFDNKLDVSRSIGKTIFVASLVYDWCYDLLSKEEKLNIRTIMLDLAEDMEIGWPPFKQSVINGHGNEAQLSRDLLAMSIAVYNEDPIPYKYCSYRIFREMIPAQNYAYSSGRHHQGSSYGLYRYSWDLYCAWIFKRMLGINVFSRDFKKIPYSWLYMKTPGGYVLPDGDGGNLNRKHNYNFCLLRAYTLFNDPILKAEYLLQNGNSYSKAHPVEFLLFNNPGLKAQRSLKWLPLTKYFGWPLGSMICRTGWNMSPLSNDVVVEMKGAGLNFGNHQHMDAGAFQIWFRGVFVGDIGMYHYYGTPYDINFNKRSIAHSVMLFYDPKEKLPSKSFSNDGGQKIHFTPWSMKEIKNGKNLTGKVLAQDFGPEKKHPLYSYMKVDLKKAYAPKVSAYSRSFCFLNLGLKKLPGVLIIHDKVATKAGVRKIWQMNSINKLYQDGNNVKFSSKGAVKQGSITLQTILPAKNNRNTVIYDCKEKVEFFGRMFLPPALRPGWRVAISPRKAAAKNTFLNVLCMVDKGAKIPQVTYLRQGAYHGVKLLNRCVLFSRFKDGKARRLTLNLPVGYSEYQVLINDLKNGYWTIKNRTKSLYCAKVTSWKRNIFVLLKPGKYEFVFGKTRSEISELPDYKDLKAVSSSENNIYDKKVFLNGKVFKVPPVRRIKNVYLVPAESILKSQGVEFSSNSKRFIIKLLNKQIEVKAGGKKLYDAAFSIDMPVEAQRINGQWYLPASILGNLMHWNYEVYSETETIGYQSRKRTQPHIIKITSSVDKPQLLCKLLYDKDNSSIWAAKGKNSQIMIYLMDAQIISGVGAKWFKGETRKAHFKVETSLDGKKWELAFQGKSSGKSRKLEEYHFAPRKTRIIRFTGMGNSTSEWNSIYNIRLLKSRDADSGS